MTARQLLILTTFFAASWLVVTLWESPVDLLFSEGNTRTAPLPAADSYMQETDTIRFDEQGNPSYRLQADNALYFAVSDHLELSSPSLKVLGKTGDDNPWNLEAARATTSGGNVAVLLSGGVHSWRNNKTGRNEFFTDDIRFSPGDNIASTDSEVRMINPDGTTTGKGLEADFDRETYHILANVRASYHVVP